MDVVIRETFKILKEATGAYEKSFNTHLEEPTRQNFKRKQAALEHLSKASSQHSRMIGKFIKWKESDWNTQ